MEEINQSWSTLNKEEFLKTYWQKKPVLVRGAFDPKSFQLSGDELAGLSLEPDAQARLIQEKPIWSVTEGPLSEDKFQSLPKSHWTLLVQEVDQWIDEAFHFRSHFDFIPRWRADDIMMSYATPEGGVGAHTDHYDVFLVQASGERQWRIETKPCDDDSYQDGLPLRVLKHFNPTKEVMVNAGDLLYLPPEFAHEGIAKTESMTWSVGFRSPSHSEIKQTLKESLPNLEISNTPSFENDRYSDPDLKIHTNPFEIYSNDIVPLEKLVESPIDSSTRKGLIQTLGKLVSRSFRDRITEISLSEEPIETQIAKKSNWTFGAESRRFFHQSDDHIALFINGEVFEFSKEDSDQIISLCSQTDITSKTLQVLATKASGKKLLNYLLKNRVII